MFTICAHSCYSLCLIMIGWHIRVVCIAFRKKLTKMCYSDGSSVLWCCWLYIILKYAEFSESTSMAFVKHVLVTTLVFVINADRAGDTSCNTGRPCVSGRRRPGLERPTRLRNVNLRFIPYCAEDVSVFPDLLTLTKKHASHWLCNVVLKCCCACTTLIWSYDDDDDDDDELCMRYLDFSYHGLFVPWTVRTLLDCSYHGLFVPSLDDSYRDARFTKN